MKAKTKQELADEYGVCIKTLNKWLLKHGVKIDRGVINPKKLEEIYTKLGNP